jgi:two-component system response regulator (stage 0 sporulation protein F)
MSKHVLVIDDDEAVRKSFVLALEDTEYPVDTIESGKKGLEMVEKIGYGLIFLDLNMPGMSGVETLRELRRMGIDTPIYIITAFHKEFLEQLKELESEGIDYELIRKPLSSRQIFLITRGVMDGAVAY